MHLAWGWITVSHMDLVLFRWDLRRNKVVGYLASDGAFSWILEVLQDEECWQIVRYGAACQVGLISRKHKNAGKVLGTSCEFLIFLLGVFSKQVRLIQALFCYTLAGNNLQSLKPAEEKKHFYSNISEKEIERERSQRKILNSGILT